MLRYRFFGISQAPQSSVASTIKASSAASLWRLDNIEIFHVIQPPNMGFLPAVLRHHSHLMAYDQQRGCSFCGRLKVIPHNCSVQRGNDQKRDELIVIKQALPEYEIVPIWNCKDQWSGSTKILQEGSCSSSLKPIHWSDQFQPPSVAMQWNWPPVAADICIHSLISEALVEVCFIPKRNS